MRKCPRKKFAGGVGIVLRFFLYLVTTKKARNPRSKDRTMAIMFVYFVAML